MMTHLNYTNAIYYKGTISMHKARRIIVYIIMFYIAIYVAFCSVYLITRLFKYYFRLSYQQTKF